MALSMEEMHKFDDVFLGILQHCGKIEPFLEAIFYFLARRTDFFHLMHSKDDKFGFPQGVAEKMILKIFEKYQKIVLQQKMPPQKEQPVSTQPPAAIQEVEVATSQLNTNDDKSEPNQKDQHSENINTSSQGSDVRIKPSASHNESSNQHQQDEDCYNGGRTDKYSWSQSISDLDIKIPVPSFVKKSRELCIVIKSDSLQVDLKQKPAEGSSFNSQTLVSGKLTHRILCEDSLWSLLPGEYISLNLEKAEHIWWTAIFEGDEEIDRNVIDTTQHVHEFDESTQADIRKVMYDQQQKMMGKPTSDEQKTHEMLKKAWDAEGSPFKGTPFDPSRVNISGSSM